MATAIFYSFSKRKNSTKAPTGSGDSYNVSLKSGTSLLSPTLLLNIASRPSYNYLSFEGRYYFVTDIVSVRNDLWEISCTVDALASWKTEIGNTTAYIMFATGGRNDIIDPRINMESDVIIHNQDASIPGLTISSMGVGTVVLSVTGVGSFGDYIVSYADVAHMIEGVDTWWNSQGYTTMEDTLRQFFYGGSAAENIKNCIGLPYSITYGDYSGNIGPAQQLYLGQYPATNNGNPIMVNRINWSIVKKSVSVTIPWEYNDWRRHSPYTQVSLYIPFIGLLNVNADEIVGASAFDIDFSFNISSGDISVEVSIDNPYKIIATCSANVAQGMTFGSAAVNGGQIASAIATGVAAFAAAGVTVASGGSLALGAAGLFGGAYSIINGAISANGGVPTGGGGLNGSAVQGLYDKILVMTYSRVLTDTQSSLNSLMGKPMMSKHTISSANGSSGFTGFVHTSGMCVSGNMTDSEHDLINAACDRGIYYE